MSAAPKWEYETIRAFMKILNQPNNDLESRLSRIKLDVLTERQLQLVTLYYMEQNTIVDIAAKLGVNKSTVSRTLSRARAKLESYLKYYGRDIIHEYDFGEMLGN